MSDSACLAVHLTDGTAVPEPVVERHLELAVAATGDRGRAVKLYDNGDVVGTLVVGETDVHDRLAELMTSSPLAGYRHHLCGVEAAGFQLDIGDSTAGNGASVWVDLVLDPAEPPVPFDDPAVLGVLRDHHAWYLPMIGSRYVGCDTLWSDGVRAAGAYVAFAAESPADAAMLAAANPWRHLAAGTLVQVQRDLFSARPPPAGPGVQRSVHVSCGSPESVGEPTGPGP